MSIDVTPGLLTSIDPELLERDLIGQVEAEQQPTPSRLDRTMNRVIRSRSMWLAPVLIVQAVLSFRPSHTLADNEATSINAGHQLIAHLLHGTPTPDFGGYFSGVPALYAVPAALIGDVGGPTLLRLASTALALIATGFVYFATRRLFGQGAALIAGPVFALNAGTLFVARFASADALCVALLAAGLWLAVTSAERPGRAIALGPCLALAGSASYLALPFIPTFLVVVGLHAARTAGAQRARRCGALALGSLAISGGVAILAAAPGDLSGLRANLLDRHVMTAGAISAFQHQLWTDIGPLVVVGALAVLLTTRNQLVAGLLLVTGFVPVAVLYYVGTTDPARDTCNLVLVFLAPLVGVTGMALLRRGRLLGLRVPLAVAGMVVLLSTGIASSSQLLNDWPSSYYLSGAPPALQHPIRVDLQESHTLAAKFSVS